jgi:hypothetical protein
MHPASGVAIHARESRFGLHMMHSDSQWIIFDRFSFHAICTFKKLFNICSQWSATERQLLVIRLTNLKEFLCILFSAGTSCSICVSHQEKIYKVFAQASNRGKWDFNGAHTLRAAADICLSICPCASGGSRMQRIKRNSVTHSS